MKERERQNMREDFVVSALPRLPFKCTKVSDQMYTKSEYERVERRARRRKSDKYMNVHRTISRVAVATETPGTTKRAQILKQLSSHSAK